MNFWEAKRREQVLAVYPIALFFDVCASLLAGASLLWPTWSLKRREEMGRMARDLGGQAFTKRRAALSWIAAEMSDDTNPAHVLTRCTFSPDYDRRRDEMFEEHSEWAHCLARGALEILFHCLPIARIMEDKFHEQRGLSKSVCEKIEYLVESPMCADAVRLPPEFVEKAGELARFSECAGLSCTQARVEDWYARDKPERRKTKPAEQSDEEIHRMADEIGVDPGMLKDVLETELSSWWDVAQAFRDQADQKRLECMELLPLASDKAIIENAWTLGSMFPHGEPIHALEKEIIAADQVIRAFIAMFVPEGIVQAVDGAQKRLSGQRG